MVLLVSRVLQILLACFPTGPCVVSSRLRRRWAYGALEWLWQDRLPAGTLHSLHSGHMSIQFTFIRSLCYLLDGCVLGEKACGLVPARPRGLEHQDSSWVSAFCLTQSGGLVSTPRTHRHTIPPSFQGKLVIDTRARFFQLQSTCGFPGDSSLAGVGLPAVLLMD